MASESTPAQTRQMRQLLQQGHDAAAAAKIAGSQASEAARVETEMVRDCLAGTGTHIRPRAPARQTARGRSGSALRQIASDHYESQRRIIAHVARCRGLPPLTEGEIEAMKAAFLAKHQVTQCPTVVLDTGMTGGTRRVDTGDGQRTARRY